MIREATEADLPRIIELGSLSLVDGPYAGIIDDVPSQAEKCAQWVMRDGKILLSVLESGEVVGLIGFLLADHHFSGQKYAAELMWYVDKPYRKSFLALELARAAERFAKKMGARDFCFTAPNNDVARAYEALGYSKLETTYRKTL